MNKTNSPFDDVREGQMAGPAGIEPVWRISLTPGSLSVGLKARCSTWLSYGPADYPGAGTG